jgi:hypothetical protein
MLTRLQAHRAESAVAQPLVSVGPSIPDRPSRTGPACLQRVACYSRGRQVSNRDVGAESIQRHENRNSTTALEMGGVGLTPYLSFIMDCETFDILGPWEIDRGPQTMHYDFWWNLPRDYMVTSEWALPNRSDGHTCSRAGPQARYQQIGIVPHQCRGAKKDMRGLPYNAGPHGSVRPCSRAQIGPRAPPASSPSPSRPPPC